jgi:hypothetical protein
MPSYLEGVWLREEAWEHFVLVWMVEESSWWRCWRTLLSENSLEENEEGREWWRRKVVVILLMRKMEPLYEQECSYQNSSQDYLEMNKVTLSQAE